MKSVYKGQETGDKKNETVDRNAKPETERKCCIVERLDILQGIVGWQVNVSTVEKLDISLGIVFSQRKLQQ